MGKIYKALARAEEEYHENYLETADGSNMLGVSQRPGKYPIQASSDRFQEIKTKLITSFPLGSVKTILFTGTAHGDGCTTTAASFAKTLAQNCRLNVLLIDANLRSPKLHEVFKVDYNQGLVDLISNEEIVSMYKKVANGNLCLIPCGKKSSGPLSIFESIRFDKFLKRMRERFDYVILDAPPVTCYAETKVMGKIVDGVILVINSGKTRKQVATRAKQEMEDAGAKILGVILNRRKHYIPGWLYKRL